MTFKGYCMQLLIRSTLVALFCLSLGACTSGPIQTTATAGGADAAFARLADDILQDNFRRHPSSATDLGIHKYDDQIEDVSRAARAAESTALKKFRSGLAALDVRTLSPANQLDHEQLRLALDAGILPLDVIRQWTKDPDSYSGGVTNAAYTLMKRAYVPAPERLKALIARELQMPAALAEARKNLDNPPRIYTEIAIEQIDGNISFFKDDVPAAFADVKDPDLLARFAKSNAAVIEALGEYKKFLQSELLPRSKGSFAWGAQVYSEAL